MKIELSINFLGAGIFLIFLTASCQNQNVRDPNFPQRQGTAIVITGAAAKIPQEAALLEELYRTKKLNNVVFISGASSGSINAVVLNAILTNQFTWEEYKSTLFGVTNNSIYTQSGEKKLPVNTDPLKQFLTTIISDKIGYRQMGDLPFPTAISIADIHILEFKDRSYRLCNKKINQESDSTLNIIDVVMASCSYPLAFPATHIRNVSTIPDVSYIDGGIAADHIPYQAVIEFEKYRGMDVDTLIIVSRKSDSSDKVDDELKHFGIDKLDLASKLGISLEDISQEGFIKRLKALQKEAHSLAERTYVYIPEFPQAFYMFDFSTLKEQYMLTSQWAKNNKPIPLEEYLKGK
jgi:predicted acylesterase/phospholipase RssA